VPLRRLQPLPPGPRLPGVPLRDVRLMAARIKTTIDRTGPFFHADPGKTFHDNLETMMQSIAYVEEGEAKSLAGPWSPGAQGKGYFVGGIYGRAHKLDGTPFKWPTAVVSQTHIYPWKGHVTESGAAAAVDRGGYRAGAQYRGGRLEAAHHIFRLTHSRVRSMIKINQAELLKGLQ